MQRGKTSLDSFSETIDLNEVSFPNINSVDHPGPWDNMSNPVENRSNYMLGSSDGNSSCTNANQNSSECFNVWDRGQSSSANNLQEQAHGNAVSMSLGRSSSFHPCPGPDPRSEDWSFEPSNMNRSPNMPSYNPNRATLNIGASLPHNLYKSGHQETEQEPTLYASSSNIENCSGSSSTFLENNDSSGPSFGSWVSSCKRKALEGASSSNQPTENLIPPFPICYPSPGNLSISSTPLNLSSINHPEQINSRNGAGMSREAPSFFPSSIVPGIAETSARNYTIRSNIAQRDPVPFDTARSNSLNSRPISNIDSPNFRSPTTMPMNTSTLANQPDFVNVSEARGMYSYPWNGSFGSRSGNSSSSFFISGERSDGVTNLEYPVIVSTPETRNIRQEQIDWSFEPVNSASSSRNHSSGFRMGSTSGRRVSSTSLLPHQIQTVQNQQRLLEAAPWFPYPPHIESDSGNRRSQINFFPSGSSSNLESTHTSRTQHQPDHMAEGFMIDTPSFDTNSSRILAAVEGRHRLIRQVLSAMQRSVTGVRLQAEDFVLIDPFINGFAEIHDRHRDLRLDVDNMSYEELLALEERIGNVNTGLSEDKIKGSMNQKMHDGTASSQILEPCSICQENYISGDDIGILDCGHEFHTSCIKQWLILKNLCPICKTTALKT